MPVSLILFISLALTVLLGLHTLLYFLLIFFFQPQRRGVRIRLAALLFALAACFITAFFWARYSDHDFLRWFYYGSVLWLGLLVNGLLIFGTGFFLTLLFKRRIPAFNRKTFGLILVFLSGLYTTYGLWNATQIQINPLSIPVNTIPDQWRGKKIAHLSDVHLGLINRKALAHQIVERIIEQKVDLVLITGDLFDGSGDSLADLVTPFNRIKAPILAITGNHETYLGIEKAVKALSRTKIKLLRDKIVEIEGLQIIGIDFPPRGRRKDLEPVLKNMDPTRPGILLYHEPTRIDTARKYNIFLQLSGHTHNGQFWPMKIFTRLIYGTYDHGLHRIGDYHIYTSSGVGTWGPPMRIGSTAEIVIITLQ